MDTKSQIHSETGTCSHLVSWTQKQLKSHMIQIYWNSFALTQAHFQWVSLRLKQSLAHLDSDSYSVELTQNRTGSEWLAFMHSGEMEKITFLSVSKSFLDSWQCMAMTPDSTWPYQLKLKKLWVQRRILSILRMSHRNQSIRCTACPPWRQLWHQVNQVENSANLPLSSPCSAKIFWRGPCKKYLHYKKDAKMAVHCNEDVIPIAACCKVPLSLDIMNFLSVEHHLVLQYNKVYLHTISI